MDRTSLLAALALAARLVAVLAAGRSRQGAGQARPRKAKQIAEQVCAACHGADGNSAIAANPNLAGQGAEYISRQLRALQGGHPRERRSCRAWRQPLSAGRHGRARRLLLAAEAEEPARRKDPTLVAAGPDALRGGDAASGVPACRLPPPERRGHPEELSAACRASTPTTRMRSSRRSRRASAATTRAARMRTAASWRAIAQQHERRADEGARRLRGRLTLTKQVLRMLGESARQASWPGARVATAAGAQAVRDRDHIASLHVYPVKGCRGIDVDARGRRHAPDSSRTASATASGWSSTTPGASSRSASCRGSRSSTTAIADERLRLVARRTCAAVRRCRSMRRRRRRATSSYGAATCAARDAGDAAANWLSDWLAHDVRLVRFDRSVTRACNPRVRGRLGRAHDVRRRLSGARRRHGVARRPQRRASPRAVTRRCR